MAAHAEKGFREKHRRKHHQTPAHALKASLRQAAAQKRLTVGLDSCVNKLKRNPESVMVCLLLQGPASSEKVPDKAASNIQHMLLQAFCTENYINLVRLVPDAALMRLVQQLAGKVMMVKKKDEDTETSFQKDPSNCSLLLIQYPEGAVSSEDKLWLAACVGGQLDILTTGHLPSD
ncbi:hypothetical protein ACOMHN_057990 [Nucella lapillus]